MAGNRSLSAVEVGLVNVMSRETVLRQYVDSVKRDYDYVLDISDNVVIYGHHMNNGSMFADLCKYENAAFYREHPTIRFDTLSGFGEYEIVAVFKTVAYSESGFKEPLI